MARFVNNLPSVHSNFRRDAQQNPVSVRGNVMHRTVCKTGNSLCHNESCVMHAIIPAILPYHAEEVKYFIAGRICSHTFFLNGKMRGGLSAHTWKPCSRAPHAKTTPTRKNSMCLAPYAVSTRTVPVSPTRMKSSPLEKEWSLAPWTVLGARGITTSISPSPSNSRVSMLRTPVAA